MSTSDDSKQPKCSFLEPTDPVCLIIKATLRPIGDTDRFQPTGFPEIGHVIYDAPRTDGNGNHFKEKVCIVDSPASMANHLETVCTTGAGSFELHEELAGLPHVVCVTDREFQADGDSIMVNEDTPHDCVVASTFTEGHRLASDYFLDALVNPTWVEAVRKETKDGKGKEVPAHWEGTTFREQLRKDFDIVEIKKDKTYFIPPAKWWNIFKTVFRFDPNSLVHGVMFAKEQIKISRLVTAHLEAFGANRVGRSGVKFDRLGKTTSGQPIFSVDEETAHEIRATFVIDLGLLRSYGRGEKGLNNKQKQLLLDLTLWKIRQLLARPFRYRTECFLRCESVCIETEVGVLSGEHGTIEGEESGNDNASAVCKSAELLNELPATLKNVDIGKTIKACGFQSKEPSCVYYSAQQLYKVGKDEAGTGDQAEDESDNEVNE